MTAATYLAKAGQNVLLFEKNKEVGGLVNSFTSNGFLFDSGVRALEDAGIILPMLKDLGIKLDVVKSTVSLGIENEIISIETIADLQRYRQLLVTFFPESEQDIDALLKVIRNIMKQMSVLYGVENPLFKDIMHDREYLFKTLLPWLPKFLFTVGKINRMNIPVEEYLRTIVKNPALCDIISQHFFKRTPASFALSYFSLYLDYFYPKGGVGKLSEAMKDKFLEYGGSLKTESRITEVFADNRTVIDHNNKTYHYENLVWAADVKTLYRVVHTNGLLPKQQQKVEEHKRILAKSRGAESVFSLFLEVDEPLESFRNIAHGHFFYTPRKSGLGETHLSELDELLRTIETAPKEVVLSWLDQFTQLNTYEISIPGLKDASLIPEGKTGMIISLLTEYNLFKAIQKAGWLSEFVHEFENRMIQVLAESVFPMLNDKVTNRFSFTPLSIENRIGSSEGAIVGWANEKDMPVAHNIQYTERSVFTPLPFIFQAGQWAYSPAGVPMSILTGKLAADNICKTKRR